MKRVTIGFSILVLSALVIGCKKPTENVVPEPDTEVQTAIDASWATFVISDIETMCSFLGENNLYTQFYTPVPGTTGTITPVRDTVVKNASLSFNQTQCIDGRFRDGSVIMNYAQDATFPRWDKDSQYTRSYGFGGYITLSDYKVDGWRIETVYPTRALLLNEMKDAAYDPTTNKLTWTFNGKFNFTHPTDSTKNMYWEGNLTKTCINSTSDSVFKATKFHKTDGPVKWEKSIVAYTGTVIGRTATSANNYTLVIDANNPLVRRFNCYPYGVGGINVSPTGSITIRKQEFHPFISGVASFTVINEKGQKLYPRQIFYGNENNSVDGAGLQCDNTGEVYIKGISYRIDFRQ